MAYLFIDSILLGYLCQQIHLFDLQTFSLRMKKLQEVQTQYHHCLVAFWQVSAKTELSLYTFCTGRATPQNVCSGNTAKPNHKQECGCEPQFLV